MLQSKINNFVSMFKNEWYNIFTLCKEVKDKVIDYNCLET